MLPWSVMATDFWPSSGHAIDELVDVAGAVEQRIFGMQMEVGEFGHG